MKLNTINDLRGAEFCGFISIAELMEDRISEVPKQMGVYVVARKGTEAPKFLEVGTGGHFKGEDPNVSLEELQKNWVENTDIVYIGKAGGSTSASTLNKRIRQYLRFGQGKPVGHKGGCFIWQLADSSELIVCWKPLTGEEPATVESRMIEDFKAQHGGKRPFANRRD